jgi:enterochelin esterase-like enzyme
MELKAILGCLQRMKRAGAPALLLFVIVVAPLAGAAWAQNANDCHPSPTNMPNAGYPRVCSDYRVMFKLEAPEAHQVLLQPNQGATGNGLGKGHFDMVKGPDGIWSVTIGPVVPGFHYYNFVVDGVPVNDPGSDAFTVSLGLDTTRGLLHATSGLEVPEKGVDFYLPKDVPHGVVQELWYRAKTTGEFRRVFVYTPPGYDKSLTTRYPVLYLQHGGSQDETGWVREGHVSSIMDNLLADKKIVPMLVVMERGYGTMAQTSAQQTVPYKQDLYTAFDVKSQDLFAQILIKDLIPMIDARYRTIPNRENRAIAGLSRGGAQAMHIGLSNLDSFSFIGSFSGPPVAFNYDNGILTHADLLNSKLKLLWIGDGTAEPMYNDILKFHQALEKNGVKHSYYEVPGTAHEWASWRRHLYDFAPRLFAMSKK